MFLPYVNENNLTILNCVSKAWFRLSEGKLCTVENYVSSWPFGHEPMFCMHTWSFKKKIFLLDDSKNKWIKIYKFGVRNKRPHLPACFHLPLIACLLSCVLLCVCIRLCLSFCPDLTVPLLASTPGLCIIVNSGLCELNKGSLFTYLNRPLCPVRGCFSHDNIKTCWLLIFPDLSICTWPLFLE